MPVDFTAYHRPSVKNLESKAYNSEVGHATPGVQIGMIGTVGCVNGQRIALLQEVVQSETTVNQPEKETARLYQATAKTIEEDEVAVFDAGFSLVKAAESGIEQCVMRLDKNCTFGRTIGQIPDKKEGQGCPPTVRRAEIIRPLARHHKERTIAATPPDEVTTMRDEDGKEVTVHIWRGLYFLERHLATIQTEREKERLRKIPINVMVFFHPDYQDPLVLGTTLLTLTPESVSEFYASRWPIEGVPQTGKYILSGGGGRHYVHHPTAVKRLPALTLMLGTLLKYVAATIPPLRTGFWDRCVKPTYGRLIKHLKKVTIPLSEQLCKKASSTAHFLKGYEAVRVANAKTGS